MPVPVGPSLQIMLLLSETLVTLTADGVVRAWEAWGGVSRAGRRLARLERSAFVATADAGIHRVVRLTEAGRLEALGGRDPPQRWSRPWDGRWRVVVFDVPDKNEALRTRLRRKLRARGFGFLQNSVWISPDSPAEIQSALEGAPVDAETLTFLESRPCGGESDQDLVRGAWDFERINAHYAAHCQLLSRRPAGKASGSGARRAWRQWLAVEWIGWQKILRSDPFLPDPLLPAGYRGKSAWAQRASALREVPIVPPDTPE